MHAELWESVVKHPSTILNTAALRKAVEDKRLKDDDMFISLDVVSLYTRIPHDKS